MRKKIKPIRRTTARAKTITIRVKTAARLIRALGAIAAGFGVRPEQIAFCATVKGRRLDGTVKLTITKETNGS